MSSKVNFQSDKIKNKPKLLLSNNSSKSSSDNSIDGSNLESKSSQLQHSKR